MSDNRAMEENSETSVQSGKRNTKKTASAKTDKQRKNKRAPLSKQDALDILLTGIYECQHATDGGIHVEIAQTATGVQFHLTGITWNADDQRLAVLPLVANEVHHA